MPYKLGEQGTYDCKGWPVLKQRPTKVWVLQSCHPTEKAARAHLIALKINVESKEKR